MRTEESAYWGGMPGAGSVRVWVLRLEVPSAVGSHY